MSTKLPIVPKGWKDPRKLPMVRITWIDATSIPGWVEWSEIEKASPVECVTIGYLLAIQPRVLKVAPAFNDQGECAEPWIIPRAWITSVDRLR